MFSAAVLVAGLLPLAGNTQSEVALTLTDHPLSGSIWDLDAARRISRDEAIERAVASPFVLLGETHDNPRHHALQATIVEALAAAGRRPLVAWEMIDSSRAEALAVCVRECDDWVRELPQRLEWAQSGWPDWTLYAPIAAVAERHRLPMAAANLSRRELERLSGTESNTATALESLPQPARARLETILRDSHCGMEIPDARLAAMVRAQRARDERMYEVLTRATGDGAVLIAGSGHTRNDFGVAFDFARADRACDVLAIAFLEVAADCRDLERCVADAVGPQAPWDLVWFTPRAVREDPCEEL